jgi:hypothetical protein
MADRHGVDIGPGASVRYFSDAEDDEGAGATVLRRLEPNELLPDDDPAIDWYLIELDPQVEPVFDLAAPSVPEPFAVPGASLEVSNE